MNARDTAIKNMRDAFTLWEEEYRANPDAFMDEAAQRAKNPSDLGEVRAIYFTGLLDRVRVTKANAIAMVEAVGATPARDNLAEFRPTPDMPPHIEALYGAVNEYVKQEGGAVATFCGIQIGDPEAGVKAQFAIYVNCDGVPPLFVQRGDGNAP